ncbi:HAD family hydrolase [Enterococcus faecium]|uniref:Cof-like hydrolase n=2 Tax=Enterococcus faecium TaxID=1352 RepID=A0AAV3L1P4_ENTFC|nr:HAD-IIB family hydrolase [Enterococcus faecium]ERT50299.1 hypothetical protein O991_01760 [Enterococcus faecium 10/96A]
MYKLIACDLDETLLTSDSKISKENVEAIHKAKILGVKFVLATGRGYEDVQNILKEIDLHDKEDEYVISFNGGAVTENKNNKLLYYQGISFEFADYLYRKGLEYDVCIHVYTKDDVFVYNIDEEEREHLEKRIEFIEIFNDNLNPELFIAFCG